MNVIYLSASVENMSHCECLCMFMYMHIHVFALIVCKYTPQLHSLNYIG